jgi:short-subunit dehydrogenase
MRFKDRVILITGAASGIGRALCDLLGVEGALLGLIDRDAAGLQVLESSLCATGVRCAAAVADVRSQMQVRQAVENLTARLGPVDILIASAGLCCLSGVDDLCIDKLEEIMQVNFLGVVYALEAVLPTMLQRRSGHIVGIASLAAFGGLPFESAYCASKAALASYLESLRPQLHRRGIAATTIFPGFVQTPLLQALTTTAGPSAFSGVVEVKTAARTIVTAIWRRRRVCCFPWSTTWLITLARFLPPIVYDWVMTRLAKRYTLPY